MPMNPDLDIPRPRQPKLEVIIVGPPKSGKTAIATIISDALRDKGIRDKVVITIETND